jgi:hypothetical protein
LYFYDYFWGVQMALQIKKTENKKEKGTKRNGLPNWADPADRNGPAASGSRAPLSLFISPFSSLSTG